MKNDLKIDAIFPKYLFWDMDYSKLNLYRDKDIIIPRAMYATTSETFESDIEKLEQIYKPKEIIFYLKNTKELISNKVCSMVAERYKVGIFKRFQL